MWSQIEVSLSSALSHASPPLPLRETASPSDLLVMHLGLHPFPFTKSHLSFGILCETFLVIVGRHWLCPHALHVHHYCLLQGTGPELELTVWKAPSLRRGNVREEFTWKGQNRFSILLLTAWSPVPTGYLLNEWLLKLNGKIPRSLASSDYYSQLCCLW